jgi:hypothetical protein
VNIACCRSTPLQQPLPASLRVSDIRFASRCTRRRGSDPQGRARAARRGSRPSAFPGVAPPSPMSPSAVHLRSGSSPRTVIHAGLCGGRR